MKAMHEAQPGDIIIPDKTSNSPNNGTTINVIQITKAAISSAAEAGVGSLQLNSQEMFYIRQMLEEMVHPQLPTPMQMDISTTPGIIKSKVQPKHTKEMNMCFHSGQWQRKDFNSFGGQGQPTLLTVGQHHLATHYCNKQTEFQAAYKTLLELHAYMANCQQGCVNWYCCADEDRRATCAISRLEFN